MEGPVVKVIVGLGNPGREYTHTRHNVGFDVVDLFAKRRRVRILSRRCHAFVGRFESHGEEILLVKPQTFMNESGVAVAQMVREYKLDPDAFLVVYDDMDLPLGKVRIRMGGSSGGHKGMTSIIRHMRSSDFPRIRIGIGKRDDAVNHVLSRFNRRERGIISPALRDAADALDMILEEGIEAAMNVYNRSDAADSEHSQMEE
jgi:PTH1 family peptidyl-tRNA hydrolase